MWQSTSQCRHRSDHLAGLEGHTVLDGICGRGDDYSSERLSITSTLNNENHFVDHSASVVNNSLLDGRRRSDPVSDMGESDKGMNNLQKPTIRMSSNLSRTDKKWGKIHALEIGHGNMDDNDKDLSRSKRGNILGGWRYYQVYESKTPIGGSGRRIEVLVPTNVHLSVVRMRRVM